MKALLLSGSLVIWISGRGRCGRGVLRQVMCKRRMASPFLRVVSPFVRVVSPLSFLRSAIEEV